MKPACVIEFIGLPAAGKTTTASMLFKRLNGSYSTAFPKRNDYRRRKLAPSERLALDIRHAPDLAGYRLRRVLHEFRHRGVSRHSFQSVWRRSRYPALLLDYISNHPAQVFILDEWLVHRTIAESWRRYPNDQRFTARFGTCPIKGMNVCYVSIELETAVALDRLSRQVHPHRAFLRHTGERDVPRLLRHWQEHIGYFKTRIARMGFPILTLTGEQEVGANVDLIATWLEGRVAAPAHLGHTG
jgi:hypothetical protein